MQGKIEALVLGAGTGGTITGVTRYVKERNPGVRAVLVESEGSVLGGGTSAPHKVEGIGNSFVPKVLDRDLIDEVVTVDENAIADAIMLLLERTKLVVEGAGAVGADRTRRR